MIFIRETGAIDNRSYRQFNSVDTYTSTRDLRALREIGLIEIKGQGVSTYYLPSFEYSLAISGKHEDDELLSASSVIDKSVYPIPDLPEGVAYDTELISKIRDIRITGWTKSDFLHSVVVALCKVVPLSATQLGNILKRKPANLRNKHLTPLVKQGLLCYTIPDNQFDNRQAYKVCE